MNIKIARPQLRAKNSQYYITHFLWLLLLLEMAYWVFIILFKGDAVLTSDMTVGMQKIEEVLNENTLYPSNWNYTNTVSFPITLPLQIIIFKATKSYVSTVLIYKVIQLIGMVVVMYFFLSKIIGMNRPCLLVCLIALISPISYNYIFEVFFDGYSYRIIVWFTMLALGLKTLSGNDFKFNAKYCLLYCLTIFLFMMGDIRYLATLILPLVVSVACCYLIHNYDNYIENELTAIKRFVGFVIAIIGTSLVCVIVEKWIKSRVTFISGYYDVDLFEVQHLENFFSRIQNMFVELLDGLGYIGGVSQMSFYSVVSLCIIGFAAYIILVNPIMMLKNLRGYSLTIQRIILFRWIGYAVSFYFWFFTNGGMQFRHILTYIVLDIILFIYSLSRIMLDNKKIISYWGAGILIFYVALNWCCIPSLADAEQQTLLENRRSAIELIEEKGYTYGYAPYWSASINSVLSEGNLSIYPFYVLEKMNWYSPVDLYLPAEENEKTFLLFTDSQYEEYSQEKYFTYLYGDYEEICQEYGHVILLYDYNVARNFRDYYESGKNLMVYMLSSTDNNFNNESCIYVETGEYIYGPYLSLDAGTYLLTVEVTNKSDLQIYSDLGENHILDAQLYAGENYIMISIGEDVKNLEIKISNPNENTLRIDKLTIQDN